jgi:hypothetical protein
MHVVKLSCITYTCTVLQLSRQETWSTFYVKLVCMPARFVCRIKVPHMEEEVKLPDIEEGERDWLSSNSTLYTIHTQYGSRQGHQSHRLVCTLIASSNPPIRPITLY